MTDPIVDDSIPSAIIAAVSKTDPNAKVAFQRRMSNLEAYITTHVNPLEQQIIDIRMSLIPMYDEVAAMRAEAREYCTHPADLLMKGDNDSYVCRFCQSNFYVDLDAV